MLLLEKGEVPYIIAQLHLFGYKLI